MAALKLLFTSFAMYRADGRGRNICNNFHTFSALDLQRGITAQRSSLHPRFTFAWKNRDSQKRRI